MVHLGSWAILSGFTVLVVLTGIVINEGCYRFLFKQPYIRVSVLLVLGAAAGLAFLSLSVIGGAFVKLSLEVLVMIVIFTPITYRISSFISKHQRPTN